jgi:hypothetical protein
MHVREKSESLKLTRVRSSSEQGIELFSRMLRSRAESINDVCVISQSSLSWFEISRGGMIDCFRYGIFQAARLLPS